MGTVGNERDRSKEYINSPQKQKSSNNSNNNTGIDHQVFKK